MTIVRTDGVRQRDDRDGAADGCDAQPERPRRGRAVRDANDNCARVPDKSHQSERVQPVGEDDNRRERRTFHGVLVGALEGSTECIILLRCAHGWAQKSSRVSRVGLFLRACARVDGVIVDVAPVLRAEMQFLQTAQQYVAKQPLSRL